MTVAIATTAVACASASGTAATGAATRDARAGQAAGYLIQTAPGYIAHVHRPAAGAQRAPAVLLIGGSGGGIGWQDYMAERLAQRGFVAVAVAYFAMDSLPKELERIPLEAFEGALTWLSLQSYVDRSRVGIGGVSKGAEAALLVASTHPELKAVAAFSPSGVVFQSVTRDFRKTSSWTRAGVEVPYVPYGSAPQGSPLVEFYRAGLRNADAATLDAATIRVERITAPILLLSGGDDTLWGSGDLATMIAARLRSLDHAGPFENVIYPNAGHLISSIRPDDVTYRGGTKEGNSFAQTDGQQRFLNFFARVLAAP